MSSSIELQKEYIGQRGIKANTSIHGGAGTSLSLPLTGHISDGTFVRPNIIVPLAFPTYFNRRLKAEGSTGLAMVSDGTVLAWGSNENGQTSGAAGVTDAVHITAGKYHMLVLRDDNTVEGWGLNTYNQISGVESQAPNHTYIQLAAGDSSSMMLRSDGSIDLYGTNVKGEGVFPSGFVNSGIIQVSSRAQNSGVVYLDGTCRVWGRDNVGQSTDSLTRTNVKEMSIAPNHVVIIKDDGTLEAWGSSGSGRLAIPAEATGIVQVATGSEHTVALKDDGTVVCWGGDVFGQSTVPVGAVDIVEVAAGDNFSLALKSDGTIIGWGHDNYGVLSNIPATSIF